MRLLPECPRFTVGITWGPTPSTVGVRAWLAELRTGHLALPTPCSEWTVRQLLTHVIGGEYVYIDLPHVTRRATSQGPGCPHKTVPLGTTSRIRA